MNRKLPYKTPEGYFEALGARLSEIPQTAARRSAWDYIRPSLAYAALILFALGVGSLLFRSVPAAPAAGAEKEGAPRKPRKPDLV